MEHFKFFCFQTILLSTLFILNYYFDTFISQPFTQVDFIAILIFLLLILVAFKPIMKVYKYFTTIRLRTKLLISVFAFVLSIVIGGVVLSLLTGEATLMW
ncbi:hypothetical protein [Bacillus kexueae]|uniref:hypothetical protein n=1 Tax=Aeribacillus kexueae TaxID=2078952 RepID=UPI001FB006CE|nr:hypothetical protein [Bacillus kexueae]